MKKPLFPPDTDIDFDLMKVEGYATFRDVRDNPEFERDKQKTVELYERYQSVIGDGASQFRNQLVKDFHGTIWNLALLYHLEQRGFALKRPLPGTGDIHAEKHATIYRIEAVNSNLGDKVHAPGPVDFGGPDDRRVRDRLLKSLGDKRDKIAGYLSKGRIAPSDKKVIAVSLHTNDRARRHDYTPVVESFLRESESNIIDHVIVNHSGDPLLALEKHELYFRWVPEHE